MSRVAYLRWWLDAWLSSKKRATWSEEERGLYLECCLVEAAFGPLPDDVDKIARLTGYSIEKARPLWPTVRGGFEAGEQPKTLVHPKVEEDVAFSLSCVENGRKGGQAKAAAAKRLANGLANGLAKSVANGLAKPVAKRVAKRVADGVPLMPHASCSSDLSDSSKLFPACTQQSTQGGTGGAAAPDPASAAAPRDVRSPLIKERGGWSADMARMWEGRFGGLISPAMCGREAAPAVKRHGWDTPPSPHEAAPGVPCPCTGLRGAWQAYLHEHQDIQFASVHDFMRTLGAWTGSHPRQVEERPHNDYDVDSFSIAGKIK